MSTRKEIVKGLLNNIHKALNEKDLESQISNFRLFVSALGIEAETKFEANKAAIISANASVKV